MMISDKSLFLWSDNRDYFYVTKSRDIILRKNAPKEAKNSFTELKRISGDPHLKFEK